MLIKDFVFKLDTSVPVVPLAAITLAAKDGVYLYATRRTKEEK